MKQFYLIFIFFLTSYFSFGQFTSITLDSQVDVDAFPVDYPNYTEVDFLTISGDDIVDLTPLSQITSINLDFNISYNPILQNLNGFNSSLSVNKLSIIGNASLTNLQGLSNITNVSGINEIVILGNPALISLDGIQGFAIQNPENITINSNHSLLNLEGFESLTSTFSFEIYNNQNLLNLTGLESLEEGTINLDDNPSFQAFTGLTSAFEGSIFLSGSNIESLIGLEVLNSLNWLSINNNNLLTDISSIENISTIQVLSIRNNPNLSICDNQMVCNTISNMLLGAVVAISNNAQGCNSVSEVAYGCDIPPVNDECSLAFNIPLLQEELGYIIDGTQSSQVPSCNDSDGRIDVWFRFNSYDLDEIDIIVDGGNYNLQLWEGDCANLTHVPNACGLNTLENISVTTGTEYYIQVWSDDTTDRGASSDLFSISVQDATLSIKEDVFNSFTLYPNPTTTRLHFKGIDVVNTITIYNALGQQVTSLTPNINNGTINTSMLSSGLYFVEVYVNDQSKTFKVLKD
ncbi:T9SS type A sorting domain-containing protein [Psychroserpens sp. S379A]|uniref:T9SS type A sorting domain-containing protein n=1 Tax=Psychroserpens sp. S379A TaxID=3415137 RepID=UPI003C7BFC19